MTSREGTTVRGSDVTYLPLITPRDLIRADTTWLVASKPRDHEKPRGESRARGKTRVQRENSKYQMPRIHIQTGICKIPRANEQLRDSMSSSTHVASKSRDLRETRDYQRTRESYLNQKLFDSIARNDRSLNVWKSENILTIGNFHDNAKTCGVKLPRAEIRDIPKPRGELTPRDHKHETLAKHEPRHLKRKPDLVLRPFNERHLTFSSRDFPPDLRRLYNNPHRRKAIVNKPSILDQTVLLPKPGLTYYDLLVTPTPRFQARVKDIISLQNASRSIQVTLPRITLDVNNMENEPKKSILKKSKSEDEESGKPGIIFEKEDADSRRIHDPDYRFPPLAKLRDGTNWNSKKQRVTRGNQVSASKDFVEVFKQLENETCSS